MPPDHYKGIIAPMPRMRPRLTIGRLMALSVLPAAALSVWNEYRYELQHRQCESMKSAVDMMDRGAELNERERVDCLSKVGREPYDTESRKDRFRQNYGGFMAEIYGRFQSWIEEANCYERLRDMDRESAKHYAEHLKECRKRRTLSFLFSNP